MSHIPRFVILLSSAALLASSLWAVDPANCTGGLTACAIPEDVMLQLPYATYAGDVIIQESGSTAVSDVFRVFNNVVDTGGGTGLGNLVILYSKKGGSLPTTFSANAVTIKEPAAGVTSYFGNGTTFSLNTGAATIRVPQDFPTIQLAVDSAYPGNTIRVGPGRWCGARITKPLTMVGENATIMGCPPGPPGSGPVGSAYREGFRVTTRAPGTSISGFVFDGAGFSDTNRSPLAYGIHSFPSNVSVDSNTFLGTGFGVQIDGNNTQITHNVFNGFTVLSNGFGGAAILDLAFGAPVTGNVIQFNTITSAVPPGDYSSVSWLSDVDVPVAGVIVSGQDGTIISNNKSSIASNAHGDAGVGILATDLTLTTINLAITDNDGRGSQYSVIVTKDQNGGTGNSVGLTLRGNFGTNLIDGSTANVRNRSINTFLQCDPTTGDCP